MLRFKYPLSARLKSESACLVFDPQRMKLLHFGMQTIRDDDFTALWKEHGSPFLAVAVLFWYPTFSSLAGYFGVPVWGGGGLCTKVNDDACVLELGVPPLGSFALKSSKQARKRPNITFGLVKSEVEHCRGLTKKWNVSLYVRRERESRRGERGQKAGEL